VASYALMRFEAGDESDLGRRSGMRGEKQPINLGDVEPGTDAEAVVFRLKDDPFPAKP
jgi:hypothetical protein